MTETEFRFAGRILETEHLHCSPEDPVWKSLCQTNVIEVVVLITNIAKAIGALSVLVGSLVTNSPNSFIIKTSNFRTFFVGI